LGLPLITAITALGLPSGGSLLVRVLQLTCNPLFWLDDILVTSPALLNDVGHDPMIASNYIGGSFNRTRGNNLVF
jgi:hypothetical protein